MTSDQEFPFNWTCPTCQHRQTDTVNPVLGPFISVTCGACGAAHSEYDLAATDRTSFDSAIERAEAAR